MGLVPDQHLDEVTAGSWAAAWDSFKQENKVDDRDWDNHTLMQNQTSPIYYLYLRASLAMATHVRAPEAKECYDYIASELPGQMAKYRVTGNARWSIDPA